MKRWWLVGAAATSLLGACGGSDSRGPKFQLDDGHWRPKDPPIFGSTRVVSVPDRYYGLTEMLPGGDALLDMNGDGLPDLVVMARAYDVLGTEGDRHFEVHLNDGDGFGPPQRWRVPEQVEKAGFRPDDLELCPAGRWAWRLEDFDGDGRPDLVVMGERPRENPDCRFDPFNANHRPHWRLFRNTGASFATEAEAIDLPPDFADFTRSEAFRYEPVRQDMDGDGTLDFIFAGTSHWTVFFVKSGKIQPAVSWSVPTGGSPDCGFAKLEANGIRWPVCDRAFPITGDQQWLLRDVDRDGRPDLLVVATVAEGGHVRLPGSEGKGWLLYPNVGDGFGEPIDVPLAFSLSRREAVPERGGPIDFYDVDGDGTLELLDMTLALGDPWHRRWQIYRYTPEAGYDTQPEIWTLSEDVAFPQLDGMTLVGCPMQGCDEKPPRGRWLTKDMDGDGPVEIVTWSELGGSTLPVGNPTWTIWSLE